MPIVASITVDDVLKEIRDDAVLVSSFDDSAPLRDVVGHFGIPLDRIDAVMQAGAPLDAQWHDLALIDIAKGQGFVVLSLVGTVPAAPPVSDELMPQMKDEATPPAVSPSTTDESIRMTQHDMARITQSQQRWKCAQDSRNVLTTKRMKEWLKDKEKIMNPTVELMLIDNADRTKSVRTTLPVVTTTAALYTLVEASGPCSILHGFPPKPLARNGSTLFSLGIKVKAKLFIKWTGPDAGTRTLPDMPPVTEATYHSPLDINWKGMAAGKKAEEPKPRVVHTAEEGAKKPAKPKGPKWLKL